jgi:hypothetical protein
MPPLSPTTSPTVRGVSQEWENFAPSTLIRSGMNMVPFVPYVMQVLVIKLLQRYRGAVIVKTRQLGITEVIASWMLYKMVCSAAYAGALFSKRQEDTSNIARRVALMAATGAVELASESGMRIATPTGGQLWFMSSAEQGARSLESIHDLLFDEAAFVPRLDRLYGAASPTQNVVGENARTIFVSTPNGKQGLFWELLNASNPPGTDIISICADVRDGVLYAHELPGFYYFVDEAGWVKIFIHWRAHPVYGAQPDYLDVVRRRDKLDEETLQREYNLNFADAAAQVFSSELMGAALVGAWDEAKWPEEASPGTFAPQAARPGRRYGCGVDTNLGGDDYFVVGILDITTYPYRLVAMVRQARETTLHNLEKLLALWDVYRPQYCAIETNNGGQIYLEQAILARPQGAFVGVNTNRHSKPVHIGLLKLFMERGHLQLPPEPVIRDELRSFMRRPDGSMSGEGMSDDIVMMLGIAVSQLDIAVGGVDLQPYSAQVADMRQIFS